jgi:hypothetical protein
VTEEWLIILEPRAINLTDEFENQRVSCPLMQRLLHVNTGNELSIQLWLFSHVSRTFHCGLGKSHRDRSELFCKWGVDSGDNHVSIQSFMLQPIQCSNVNVNGTTFSPTTI